MSDDLLLVVPKHGFVASRLSFCSGDFGDFVALIGVV